MAPPRNPPPPVTSALMGASPPELPPPPAARKLVLQGPPAPGEESRQVRVLLPDPVRLVVEVEHRRPRQRGVDEVQVAPRAVADGQERRAPAGPAVVAVLQRVLGGADDGLG